MTTIGNSLALAGSSVLAAGVSTELPYLLRAESALANVQFLESCRAQWGDRVDQPLYREAVSRALESFGALPEVEDVEAAALVGRVRQGLAGPEPAEAISKLVDEFLPLLRANLPMDRGSEEQIVRDRLLTMNRIINGGAPIAGLPDPLSIPSLYPSVPQWARTIRYRIGGEDRTLELNDQGYASLGYDRRGGQAEISFQHGRFWIRDPRDSSLWDLRNWAGRWFGGVFVRREEGDLRLRPRVQWPVAPGDAVRLGRRGDVELLLPSTPILESIKGRILAARDFDELSRLLRANGLHDILGQIDRYRRTGEPFTNIPHEGGLSLKIQELVLRNEFARVHRRYLSYLPEDLAMRMLSSLAVAVQNASSPQELLDVALISVVPGTTALFRGASRLFAKEPGASLADVGEEFGYRSRVQSVSSHADLQLRGEVARLTRELERIGLQLVAVREKLREKTAALETAERAASEAGARFEAARRQWEEASERVREEREAEQAARREDLERKRQEYLALKDQRDAADREVEGLRTKVKEAEAERARFQGQALEAERKRAGAEAELEEVREAASEGIAERDRRIEALRAEVEAARKAQPAATPPILFGGADPQTEAVTIPVRGEATLVNSQGKQVGKAAICAGGEEAEIRMPLDEGLVLSARTTIGISKNGRQEDGFYVAKFNLPDGTPVKVLVVSDGAGGEGQTGFAASSAFLQGVHARVVKATARGETDLLAGQLAESGVLSVQKQKEKGTADQPATGSAAVIVIVGNRATIATVADATVLYAKPMPDGSRRVVGYSDADYMEVGGQKAITAGIHQLEGFHYYYIADVGDGASFTAGSDGFHENVHPDEYKIQVSPWMRDNAPTLRGQHLQPPTHATFQTIDQMLTAVAGREDAAALLHDAAFEVMKQYRRPKGLGPVTFHILGQEMQTTAKPGRDNIVVGHLQHARNGSDSRPAPAGYEALPGVVEVMKQTEPFPMISLTFQPAQSDGKFLVLGRSAGLHGVINHSTVSRRHGHLLRDTKTSGEFLADTWYYQPIADNPNGDIRNGTPVARNQWVALADGDHLRMGGFPLIVSVDQTGNINFSTDTSPA